MDTVVGAAGDSRQWGRAVDAARRTRAGRCRIQRPRRRWHPHLSRRADRSAAAPADFFHSRRSFGARPGRVLRDSAGVGGSRFRGRHGELPRQHRVRPRLARRAGRQPGFTELEDISKVRDWVVGSAIGDPRLVILSGRSWGGYLTLLGLGVQPERWSLGIAGVPVADYVAAYEDEMEPLKAFDRSIFKGSPEEIPEVYRERSPITYVDRVLVPVL